MVPARSRPRMAGSGWRACAAAPARILMSSGLTALAEIRTSAWPGPGTGHETDERRNGASCRSSSGACIVAVDIIAVLFAQHLQDGHFQPAWKSTILHDIHAYLFGADGQAGVERSQNLPGGGARGHAWRRGQEAWANAADNGAAATRARAGRGPYPFPTDRRRLRADRRRECCSWSCRTHGGGSVRLRAPARRQRGAARGRAAYLLVGLVWNPHAGARPRRVWPAASEGLRRTADGCKAIQSAPA